MSTIYCNIHVMAAYELQTGSVLRYETGDVLPPDIVTEHFANLAVESIRERRTRPPHQVLELGVGTGAFLRSVSDQCGEELPLHLVGVDVDSRAIETARNNLNAKPENHTLSLLKADWSTDLFKPGSFDCIYGNPPYLENGTPLLPEFQGSPEVSVYTGDIEETYKAMTRHMVPLLKIGGIALVRLPGDGMLTSPNIYSTTNFMSRYQEWIYEELGDCRLHIWQSLVANRRISGAIVARIGSDIKNAPLQIQNQEEYWSFYGELNANEA